MIQRCLLIYLFGFLCFPVFSQTGKQNISSILQPEKQDTFFYSYYEGIRLKEYPDSIDKALKKFEYCLSLDSTDAGAYAEAGMIYDKINQHQKAISYLENSCRLTNYDWWYGIALLGLYDDYKIRDKAIVLAEKLQKKYPYREEIYSALVSLYKDAQDYKKAIQAYNKLEKIYGIDEFVSFDKFRLYLQLNQVNKGVAEIDKLIKKYPLETRYKVLRGDVFMQQNEPAKALEIYNQVLINDPSNPYVYLSLSQYYSSINDSAKASSLMIDALKSDKLAVEEKMNILSQYVNKLITDTTRLGETESLFKLLTEQYPFEETVHEYYAGFLKLRNRLSDANQEYETIVSINPKNQNAWMQILQELSKQQKYKDVISTAERGIRVFPEFSAFYFYKAIAEYQLQQYEEALSLYAKAAELLRTDQQFMKSDIYGQMGDIYFKLGKKPEAFAAYDEALKANPQNDGVLNNYAYFLSNEKTDLAKAERMSAQTVTNEPNNSVFLDTYAWIFYQRENYALAKFYMERAVTNLKPDQDTMEIYEHYGDILIKTGNKDKAVEMWKKSMDAGNVSEELKTKISQESIK